MDNLPIFRCPRISTPVTIDGDLSKPPWRDLPSVGELVLSNGDGPPRQRTQAWACWDAANFYVGFAVEDSDIRATFTQREDKVWMEEAVEFFVSPDGDLTHYYEFQFSPRNVVRDIWVENPNGRMAGSSFHGEWACLALQSAVQLDGVLNEPSARSKGWSITIALPTACLLPPGRAVQPGDEWRINFLRVDRWPVEEFSAWSPTFIRPWEFHVPRYFGHLIFEP